MDNILFYIIIAQWSLITFFVLLHYFIGLKRGAKKTIFYTITSLFVTLFLMILISFVSVSWMFSSPDRFIGFAQFLGIDTGGMNEYLSNPEIFAVILSLLDLVLRLVIFVIVYPLLKLLLNRIFIKKMYNITFKEKSERRLAKNKNVKVVAITNKKPHPFSRLVGSLFGAFRGLVVSIVILLPLIIVSSAFNQLDDKAEDLSHVDPVVRLNNYLENNSGSNASSDIKDIINAVGAFNSRGIGNFTKKVKLSGKPVEEHLFDIIFTTSVKIDDEKHTINLSEEIKAIGSIVEVAVNYGFFDNDFDYLDINYDDHYKGVDLILTNLGDSSLLQIGVIIGLNVVDANENLQDQLGFKISENEYTKDAFNDLKKVIWKDELGVINDVVKNILLTGSVRELNEFIKTPVEMLELPQEKKQSLASLITSLGDLEIINAGVIGVEYLLQSENILSKITYEENPYEYLHEKLDFLFEKDFLREEIKNLGGLVEVLVSDDFSELDYRKIVKDNGKVDVNLLLDEEYGELVVTLVKEITRVKSVVKSLPLAIDYAVLTSTNETIEDLSEQLLELADEVNFENEIDNIGSIYALFIKLGLGSILEDKPATIELIDRLLENDGSFRTIKEIVGLVFEESEVINGVLEIAGEPLVDKFINDEDIKRILIQVINEEEFKYGLEVISLLNVAEELYRVTNIGNVVTLINEKKYLHVADVFGQIDLESYDRFKTELLNLQILKYASVDVIDYAVLKLNVEQIVIPSNISYSSIQNDLEYVLDLAYALSKGVHEQELKDVAFGDINIAKFAKSAELESYIAFDYAKHKESIFVYSIVEFLRVQGVDLLGTRLAVDVSLLNMDSNNEAWFDEINGLLLGALDLTSVFSGNDEDFIISVNNIKKIKNLNDIPSSVLLRFNDQVITNKAFSKIFNLRSFNYNASNVVETLLDGNNYFLIDDYVDDSLYEDKLLSGENLTELITIVARIFESFVYDESLSIDKNLKQMSFNYSIDKFNNLDNNLLEDLGQTTLINHIFRRAVSSEKMQSQLYNIINNLNLHSELSNINDGLFTLTTAKDVDGYVLESTLSDILLYAHSLKVPASIRTSKGNDLVDLLLDVLDADKLDDLFNIRLLNDLLSNAITLEEVKNYGEVLYESLSSYAYTPEYDQVYDTVLAALLHEGSFDGAEIARLRGLYKDLEDGGITYKNITQTSYEKLTTLDRQLFKDILSTKLIHYTINTAVNNENALRYAANELTVLGRKYDDSFYVSEENVYIPVTALDENERLSVDELYSLVNTFLNLNIKKYSDLKNIKGVETLKQVLDVDTFELLLDSNIIYTLLGNTFNKEFTLEKVASLASNLLKDNQVDIVLTVEDLKLEDDFIEDGYIKKSELVAFYNGIYVLNTSKLTSGGAFVIIDNSLEELFTEREGRLVVEHLLDSHIIHKVLNTALNIPNNESVETYVLKQLNGLFNNNVSFDLTDDLFSYEDTTYDEYGFVSKEEIISLLYSMKLANINKDLHLNDIINLMDKNVEDDKDDFDRLLDSKVLYSLLSNVLLNETLLTFANNEVNGLTGDIRVDGLLNTPEEAKSNGMFSKQELRNLLTSVKVLNITKFNEFSFSMILDLVNNEEKLDTFLDSDYLRVVLSRALLSDSMKDLLASSGSIDGEIKFNLVEKTEHGDMTKEEVKKVFVSLNVLGIEDFDNIEFDNETLQNLSEENLNKLIDSNYFYEVVDLTLKAQLEVPEGALDDNGYIKKDEVRSLIDALNILDGSDIITVGMLRELVALDSRIIDRLITDNIKYDEDTEEGIRVPDSSYISVEDMTITNLELNNLLEAITILGLSDDDSINELDFNDLTITSASYNNLVAIGGVNGSPLIIRLISENIIEVFEEDLLTIVYSSDYDIKLDELKKLGLVLNVLGEDNELGEIDVDELTVQNLKDMNAVDSNIFYSIASKSIIENVDENEVVVKRAYITIDGKTLIKKDELTRFIDTLVASPFAKITEVNDEMDNLTANEIKAMYAKDSIIFYSLLSNEVMTVIENDNVVSDAFVLEDGNKYIEPVELGRFIDTLIKSPATKVDEFEGLVDTLSPVDIDTMYAENSRIFYSLLSNEVMSVIENDNVVSDAFILEDSKKYVEPVELGRFIDTLIVSPATKVDEFEGLVDTLSPVDIDTMYAENSRIFYSLLSNEVMSVIENDNVVSDAFILEDSKKYVEPVELGRFIDTLIVSPATKVDEFEGLVDTMTPTIIKTMYSKESLVFYSLVSNAILEIIDLDDIVNDAYLDIDGNDYIEKLELERFLDTLIKSGVNNINAFDGLVDTVNPTIIKGMYAEDSLVFYSLLSKSIYDSIGANKIKDEATVTIGTKVFISDTVDNPELTRFLDAIELLDIGNMSEVNATIEELKIDKSEAIIDKDSIIINKIVSDILSDIDYLETREPGIREDDNDPNSDIKSEHIKALISDAKLLPGYNVNTKVTDIPNLIENMNDFVEVTQKIQEVNSIILEKTLFKRLNDLLDIPNN